MFDLVPLCSSGGRRFRELVRIHRQNPDPSVGVHFGKGDFDVGVGDQVILFGYAVDETGKTKVSLMVGLGTGGETAILYGLELGNGHDLPEELFRCGDRRV